MKKPAIYGGNVIRIGQIMWSLHPLYSMYLTLKYLGKAEDVAIFTYVFAFVININLQKYSHPQLFIRYIKKPSIIKQHNYPNPVLSYSFSCKYFEHPLRKRKYPHLDIHMHFVTTSKAKMNTLC